MVLTHTHSAMVETVRRLRAPRQLLLRLFVAYRSLFSSSSEDAWAGRQNLVWVKVPFRTHKGPP